MNLHPKCPKSHRLNCVKVPYKNNEGTIIDEKRSVTANPDNSNSNRLRFRFFFTRKTQRVSRFPTVPITNNITSIVAVKSSIGLKCISSSMTDDLGKFGFPPVENESFPVVFVYTTTRDSMVEYVVSTVDFNIPSEGVDLIPIVVFKIPAVENVPFIIVLADSLARDLAVKILVSSGEIFSNVVFTVECSDESRETIVESLTELSTRLESKTGGIAVVEFIFPTFNNKSLVVFDIFPLGDSLNSHTKFVSHVCTL